MWCPSVSLSVWANAWLAGVAAPDDVLDALSQWAPRHSVTAYDSVAAGRTGLPWPDLTDAGAVSLLQTLRTSAGRGSGAPALGVALPVPGDVRGLPAGTQFQRDAVTAGEALIMAGDPAEAIGLVPDFEYPDVADEGDDPDAAADPCALSWTVYSVPGAAGTEGLDLGESEYAMRAAVRSAADALSALHAEAAGGDIEDPRSLVEQVVEAERRHSIPDHAPTRALRVLDNAAYIDAIITVSSGLIPIGLNSSADVRTASEALRPLSGVVRSARLAAVSAILHSAWQR
jgi:hypothetical protein